MFGFKFMRVTGRSMLPYLKPNQLILVKKIYRHNHLQIGDIVVVQHPQYGYIIKQISHINEKGFLVKGSGDGSTASFDIGLIKKEQIYYTLFASKIFTIFHRST